MKDARVDRLLERLEEVERDVGEINVECMGKSRYWTLVYCRTHSSRLDDLERKLTLVMDYYGIKEVNQDSTVIVEKEQ